MEADGLSARERKKLEALMAREAQAAPPPPPGSSAGSSRRRAPPVATYEEPPEAVGTWAQQSLPGRLPPSSKKLKREAVPPKKRGRKKAKPVDRNKQTAAANIADFHAFCDSRPKKVVEKLNEHNAGTVTVFSLGGYRGFHAWRAKEIAAMDARAFENSVAGIAASGRRSAAHRSPPR